MSEALTFEPGELVVVKRGPEADPKYAGRTGIIIRYAPNPDLEPGIPWRVGFADGDVAGFEADELARRDVEP